MNLITGNTYPVREQIKAMGGKWNPKAKGWMMPDAAAADAARAIVADAGPAPTRSPRRRSYGSTYTLFSSGAVHYQNRKGRCEDAPCCGCCS